METNTDYKREGLRYYISSHIKSQSLDNVGLAHALDLLAVYLKADGAALYRFKNDNYEFVAKEELARIDLDYISEVIAAGASLVEGKEYLNVNFKSDNDSYLMFIPFKTANNIYMLVVSNSKNKDERDLFIFVEILKESLSSLLERYENKTILEKNSLEDGLTGLDNRASFNKKEEELTKTNNNYIFVILDLFRLKYVNDNISHEAGDKYIVGTADILKRYFPKYVFLPGKDGIDERRSTGTVVYRIGGDEFVIVTESSRLEDVENRLQLAATEVQELNLGVDASLPLGLNYGIAVRSNNENVKEVYVEADKKLSANKREMYSSLGLDRRR